ncbi:MAG: XRE family transcriptional regulator [Youngiibacter sp.]|nr:XRE family transcriptional regulator [Youngiibacter sp.]
MEMELNDKIKQRIRALREANKLRLQDVADCTGVTIGTVNKWESGEIKTIKMSHMRNMAELFDVSVPYLLGEGENLVSQLTNKQHHLFILGRIPAGTPVEAVEYREGTIEIPQYMVDRYGSNNLFALRITGESMNKEVANGSIGIFVKDDDAPSGSLAAVALNGNDVTLKRLVKIDNYIMLKPESHDKSFEIKTIDMSNGKDFHVVGRLIATIKLFI